MGKDQANIIFMMNTLESVYPDHTNYPFETLREIEETEGEDGPGWNDYADYVIRAYWMKRAIEIASDGTIRF